MNNATRTQQNPTTSDWTPKTEWIETEIGRELTGCHCVSPLDDCGCEDCQERHGYRAVYNRETQTFDRIAIGRTVIYGDTIKSRIA